jgi:hypothetical protein
LACLPPWAVLQPFANPYLAKSGDAPISVIVHLVLELSSFSHRRKSSAPEFG